jgi:hypothetical protein
MSARRNLSLWSRRILRRYAEAVLPDGEGAPAGDVAAVVDFIDGYAAHMPRLYRLLFPIGLLYFELTAIWPFSLRTLASRRRRVERWSHSRVRIRRELMKALRGLCLLHYYSQPAVTTALGYSIEAHVADSVALRRRLLPAGERT